MHKRTLYWREYARLHRKKKREQRRKSEQRAEYKIHRTEYNREWARKNKENVRANRLKNKAKDRCREKTKYAIVTGKLFRKPCRKCGAKKVEAHHVDYSKPLAIVWLCRKHHSLERRLS